MPRDYKELLRNIGITSEIKNPKFYLEALTQSSYLNEHKCDWRNYERVEFLGDAVVELIVTKYIYLEYPNMSEGDLSLLRSNLVRMETLATLAKGINLGDYILLGSGEAKAKGNERPALLGDVYEALVGAIYLDQGYHSAEQFVFKQYAKVIKEHGMEAFLELKDAKTKLQELVQADKKRALSYELVSSSGPANDPTFEMIVKLDDMILGKGIGKSKKLAEQEAAKDALSKMAR